MCPPLKHPSNGEVAFDTGVVGDTALYRCFLDYLLFGESTRECLHTGNWSGEEPVCQSKPYRHVLESR